MADPDAYEYTDPVKDATWPRITKAELNNPPDAFPEGWGAEPTERDQAVIDANG